jgi:hypothetical protein
MDFVNVTQRFALMRRLIETRSPTSMRRSATRIVILSAWLQTAGLLQPFPQYVPLIKSEDQVLAAARCRTDTYIGDPGRVTIRPHAAAVC